LIVPEISDPGLAHLKAFRSLNTLDLSDTKFCFWERPSIS
jgi:hypothetical protein